MRYMRAISLSSSFFELYILFFMFRDELGKTYLYLTLDERLNAIILLTAFALIFLRLILTTTGFFKSNWKLIAISSIVSAALSCLWMIMFFNTITHDHFRTLTPLLAYLSTVKFIMSWYFAEVSKAMRLYGDIDI